MTWSEFWHMGGYALYVWGSFGVTAVCMVAELIALKRNRTEVFRRLRRIRNIENS